MRKGCCNYTHRHRVTKNADVDNENELIKAKEPTQDGTLKHSGIQFQKKWMERPFLQIKEDARKVWRLHQNIEIFHHANEDRVINQSIEEYTEKMDVFSDEKFRFRRQNPTSIGTRIPTEFGNW